ncbi:MAG TPA: M48 family metalloprotease [Chitinophagaceae bacterium]|nr:M48 family metalloprotease [Chitinophagaceae bacterium]
MLPHRLNSLKSILCLILLFCLSYSARSQWTYQITDLSSEYYRGFYEKLIQQKTDRVFEEKKKQKGYEAVERYQKYKLASFLAGDLIVHDTLLQNYINGLLVRIAAPNKDLIKQYPEVLISRSGIPNAFNMGLGIIVINCGYIYQAQTEEDILICIAHELGHFLAKDAENTMEAYINLLHSKTLKDSVKDIVSARYNRFTRGEELWKQYAFEQSSHSRFRESEADSTAAALLRKAGIPFDAAYFLRLDSMKLTARMNFNQPLPEALLRLGWEIPTTAYEVQANASSRRSWGTPVKDSVEQAGMKTHPDCSERYERTKGFTDAGQKSTPIPLEMRKAAYRHIVMYALTHNELGEAFFLLLQETRYSDSTEQKLWGQLLARKLILAHRKMSRIKAINVRATEDCSKDYNQVQTLLTRLPEPALKNITMSTTETANGEWQYAIRSLDALSVKPEHQEKHLLSDAYPCSPLNEIMN